ncbi:hypothetical protein G9A89_012957 [Geosiphon pyriformis]|nr:hypothetical protein G9A89_012957 [Geosiphon pyriformis]
MSKKKAPKGAFHGLAGVVLGNVKHSGNEKDISLSKSELSDNVFFNVDSLSGDKKGVDITDINVGSLLNSAANTPKAKHIDISAIFGFPLSSPNFVMDDDKKIEVSTKKFFALDINLSTVDEKSMIAKTQFIRKIFSSVNGFGGATTSSKFKEIIRFIFTSEKSIEMAVLLVKEKEIDVNSNLKRQGMRSD